MPRYDYRCINCGEAFQLIHGINEENSVKCNNCGGVLKKLPSIVTIKVSNSVGKIVIKSIEEARAEVKETKAELRNRELKI